MKRSVILAVGIQFGAPCLGIALGWWLLVGWMIPRLGLGEVAGFSVGGEGGALFDALLSGGKLVACCALFPELVGARAVDVLATALAGGSMPAEVKTPHAILTRETLDDFYRRDDSGWSFAPSPRHAGFAAAAATPVPQRRGRPARIGFVPHYPAHDWYRNMQKAMQHWLPAPAVG